MKKKLSVSEIQNSNWPQIFADALGDNLVSAFVHGDCLMEGHDAFNDPWTVSFILRDNSAEKLVKLQELLPKAQKENIQFLYFFTQDEIKASEDVFPLEFLHLANRNQVIAGSEPFCNYNPDLDCLRLECERELRGLMIHLRQAYIYINEDRNPQSFFVKASSSILPIMYGVYYLSQRAYPENHEQIFGRFPALRAPVSTKDKVQFLKNVNNYIDGVTQIINMVDSMKF